MARPRKDEVERKVTVGFRLPPDLVAWIAERVEAREFYNPTHAIEVALREAKERREGAPSRASRTTTSKK